MLLQLFFLAAEARLARMDGGIDATAPLWLRQLWTKIIDLEMVLRDHQARLKMVERRMRLLKVQKPLRDLKAKKARRRLRGARLQLLKAQKAMRPESR